MQRREPKPTDPSRTSGNKIRNTVAGLALATTALIGVGCAPGGAKTEARTAPTEQTTPDNSIDSTTMPAPTPTDTEQSSDYQSPGVIETPNDQQEIVLDGEPGEPKPMFTDESGNFSMTQYITWWEEQNRDSLLTGNYEYMDNLKVEGVDSEYAHSQMTDNYNDFLEQTGHERGDAIPGNDYVVKIEDVAPMTDGSGRYYARVTYITKESSGTTVSHAYDATFWQPILEPTSDPNVKQIFGDGVSYKRDRVKQ